MAVGSIIALLSASAVYSAAPHILLRLGNAKKSNEFDFFAFLSASAYICTPFLEKIRRF